ncbi:hypothetical protein CKAH01_11349 [Colletotrichum kahawae]|uniref:Uncharacterized protein n=1 Tax=Colletotrichum kahawae TaxID=34407 RepID=A0AAE0DDY8_COLKA|nr:hypothetical protein CKAH01_11349 [Colletotrichum kahawae]
MQPSRCRRGADAEYPGNASGCAFQDGSADYAVTKASFGWPRGHGDALLPLISQLLPLPLPLAEARDCPAVMHTGGLVVKWRNERRGREAASAEYSSLRGWSLDKDAIIGMGGEPSQARRMQV